MRGAEFALQFEHPKLGAIATASMSGQDFASMLERAIRASNKEREVKALSKHARSRQIDQSFLLRVSFSLFGTCGGPHFLSILGSAKPAEQNNKCDEAQQPQSTPNPFRVHVRSRRKASACHAMRHQLSPAA